MTIINVCNLIAPIVGAIDWNNKYSYSYSYSYYVIVYYHIF